MQAVGWLQRRAPPCMPAGLPVLPGQPLMDEVLAAARKCSQCDHAAPHLRLCSRCRAVRYW